jgi:hypothetical protein
VATVSGNTVTIVGAGTATLTATQAADGSYAAGSASATFTVAKATPTLAAIPDINFRSWDHSDLCIADNANSCPLQSHSRFVQYTLTLGAAASNPADLGAAAPPSSPAAVLRLGDAMTVGTAGVVNAAAANFYSGPSWSIRTVFAVSYPRSTPASTTVTVTRAATLNFNAVSRTFTLTVTPDSGGYCFNAGNYVIRGPGDYECVCPAEYTGERCELPAP